MDRLVKLMALGFFVVGISACGKTGELTPVKVEPVKAPLVESNIMPHNSK